MGGAVDAEVGGWLAREGQLRAATGIVGGDGAVRKAGPVFAHGSVEAVGPADIHAVIDRIRIIRVQPFDIRSETHAAAEIQRDVHAETAFDRSRVDEALEHRLRLTAEIAALGEREGRQQGSVVAGHAVRDAVGIQAGAVDDAPGPQCHRFGAARFDPYTAIGEDFGRGDRRVEGYRPAMILKFALQREHVAVAVEDAGFGREHGRLAGEVGLHRHGFGAGEEGEAFHIIAQALGVEAFHLGDLRIGRGDDQLAGLAIGDPVGIHPGVELAPAGHAVQAAQAVGGIVEAGVHDFAVAGRRQCTDGACRFEDQDILSIAGQRRRAGEADGARPDDDGLDVDHGGLASCPRFRRRRRRARVRNGVPSRRNRRRSCGPAG